MQSPKPALEPLNRRRIFPFYYSVGERTVHIVATLTDQPGALASLLSELSSKVNLIGTSSYSTGENAAVFSGFGRVLSENESAQSIRDLTSNLPHVTDCRVWDSKDGLLVDRFHTGFWAGAGEPYLIFPNRGLSETFEGVVRALGSGGEYMLYTEGLNYAKVRGPLYKKIMGPHPESRLDELAALVGALGYGQSIATADSSGMGLKLTSRECFECSTPTHCKRTCSFLRGMAVGIFSCIFDRELVGTETRCRQRGHEECVFILTAKDRGPLF